MFAALFFFGLLFCFFLVLLILFLKFNPLLLSLFIAHILQLRRNLLPFHLVQILLEPPVLLLVLKKFGNLLDLLLIRNKFVRKTVLARYEFA